VEGQFFSTGASVFSALANDMVNKIVRFSSKMVSRTKNTKIYPGLGPSSKVLPYGQQFDIDGNKCYKGLLETLTGSCVQWV
jgi:hypothetical protein